MTQTMKKVSLLMLAVFAASFIFAVASLSSVGATPGNGDANLHCPDHSVTGWALDKVNSATGDETVDGVRFKWGGDPGVLKVKNNNEYAVTVYWCAKGGTNFYSGTYNTGEVATELAQGEKVTVNFNQEVSYFLVYKIVKDEPSSRYLFQFAKEWKGDEIDLENVDVSFFVGDFEWKLGDPAVPVKPGQELSPLSEKVTGLPENCTYVSDLPESYIVFEDMVMDESRAVATENSEEPEVMTDTLTVTNTVTCEEEGEVLAETTTTPTQTAVVPTGSANAGGAGQIALFGLMASFAVAVFGALARKFSRI